MGECTVDVCFKAVPYINGPSRKDTEQALHPTSPSPPNCRVPYIPHDVWVYIAQFLPLDVSKKLIRVNKAFYEVGMNARYREVRFTNSDVNMFKTLDRLK